MANTPANAINQATTGITGFTGTAFVGTPVIQHDVLVGGSTSSTISNVGPGTAGQVLQSGGASADPAYSTATYPSTAGTSGNVITSDGTNFISQALPSSTGFSSIVIQTFTTPGANTYTPTSGMKYCIVEMIAGGGAGGGAPIFGGIAGGGGSGEYARGVFSSIDISTSQVVTIGAGGTGVSESQGNTGGTTSLGSLMTCIGGGGGFLAGDNLNAGNYGGTGGTGGNFHSPGMSGQYPITGGSGGVGADSIWGGGGIMFSTGMGSSNGSNAIGYGAGGGGSYGPSTAGGNGSSGACIITEYIS